jgi:NADH-quinone oxidoreductase subunit L
MTNFLFLIPGLPFAAFLILALLGKRLSPATAARLGAGSVGLSALISLISAIELLSRPPETRTVIQTLWTWMQLGVYAPRFSLLLDPLSLVMTLVITVVGFLILLYSAEFMEHEDGYSRFFAYMDLFIGMMLTLVLADNLLLLYLGWEGVGLCSYLLIGFWYRDPANGAAARKAFIVTRIGDTALALGLFLLFTTLGTLDIRDILTLAPQAWPAGSHTAVLAAALLLGGAVGKSAQMPLQTWLPDAMAGPTPVSALIHAATMVTAGVYLIARTHGLFMLAPPVQTAVAVIGAATLLLASFSALVQKDIKRVLAYSTISQIGYMFLALGVGAWTAAIFHFMTHAFFKALLFLGAGSVILALHHEHDIFRMGGLRARLPVTFWTFLVGAASLAALPFVTAGFYSKDLILWDAWISPQGSPWLWLAGLIGAFITTIYSFRLLFLVFFGQQKQQVTAKPGWRIEFPLLVLAFLSLVAGFVELPSLLGDFRPFSEFLGTVLPPFPLIHDSRAERLLLIITEAVQAAGIAIAWLFFLTLSPRSQRLLQSAPARPVHAFWYSGWGFDALYEALLVRPFKETARAIWKDPVDAGYRGIAAVHRAANALLSSTQNGSIRWYAMAIVFGAAAFLGIALIVR